MPFPPIIFLAIIMCGSAVVITAMLVVSYQIASWRRLSRAAPSDDIVRRLERIEHITEATAIEIERLAESNRFMTRLLAERSETIPR